MPTPRRHEDAAARQRAYRLRRKLARTNEPRPKGLPQPSRLPSMPSAARWKALRQQAEDALRTLLDEMESYCDERSEAWQEGDKGQAFYEDIESLDEVLEAVQNIKK